MSKDCCSTKNQKKHEKGSTDHFVLWVILITIFLFGIVVYFGTKMGSTTEVVSDSKVELFVESKTYDWGTIDYNAGIVTKSFEIQNTGNDVLKLYDVKTSCMCTTAQLKTLKETSSKYGMHEKSSEVFEVNPGEKVELLIEFDPAFHGPSGVGPVTRTITMNTNAVNNPTLTFDLTGIVVKK